jgi:Cu-processing system permease protein
VYLAGLELTVLTAVAVMFSALSSPVIASLFTLGAFVLGQWSYDLRTFAAHFPSGLGAICTAAANLVPNLPLFNMRTLAAAGSVTSPVHLGIATLYALAYCVGALALGAVAFEARDLK